jgi:hypothetical protein
MPTNSETIYLEQGALEQIASNDWAQGIPYSAVQSQGFPIVLVLTRNDLVSGPLDMKRQIFYPALVGNIRKIVDSARSAQ